MYTVISVYMYIHKNKYCTINALPVLFNVYINGMNLYNTYNHDILYAIYIHTENSFRTPYNTFHS